MDFSLACKVVRKMIEEEFPQMDLETQISMAIVTIHQDVGFEVLLPETLKIHPIVQNYYESRWKGEYRKPETKEWCTQKADKMFDAKKKMI